ncbi:hypothetical protein [Streptomyces sp. NPDC048386]|uniref:hypothetical protein n=1 Tax=Streptomyces sp. NPDC048386 TaxID=3365541 RepID=UPI003714E450
MTREERRASIRALVDDAPLLPPEDIDRLRGLMPTLRGTAARQPAQLRRVNSTAA